MRIAYIAAGAGGMYCGSCIRDNALAAALKELGHDVAFLPVYTPLRTDEAGVEYDRVFYGAINVYMEQRLPLLARLPPFVHHLLDRPGLLRLASRLQGATDAKMLGALSLSMLQGEEGRQRRELEELAAWLRDEYRPQVVQLTNSMLLGLARRLRQELPGVTLVCNLQGEDIFLEDLAEPYKSRVFAELRRRAREVELFIATSRYYAEYMADFLGIDPERVRVARIGLSLEGHGSRRQEPPADPLVIGYLARFCPEKGFHLLLEAFRKVRQELGPGRVRLRAAGYLGPRDQEYFDDQRRRVEEWGLADDVDLVGEVDRQEKIAFLEGLHVFSMPTVYREPKGLPVLEALANGVPVVLPDHGAFPELMEATGGGILVEPNQPEALATGILELAADATLRRELGERGKRAVHEGFSARRMAEENLDVYRRSSSLAESA